MKKGVKQQNKQKAEEDIEELYALGFKVLKFTEWHWRITKPDYENFIVDVWPTRNKAMLLKNYKPFIYTNLFVAIKELFNRECF